MYIKIKHIKKVLLISACIFFAGFNYLTYVKADSTAGGSKSCDKTIDADCDGLTDTEEALYGTDTNKADSDGDGYSDGVEVKSGYDPTKPAPGDRIITTAIAAKSTDDTTNSESFTETFSRNLDSYIKSNGGATISTTDVNNFVDSEVQKELGSHENFDTLPEVDTAQIKILDQTYPGLSAADKKQRKIDDTNKYMEQIFYLLVNNAPRTITSKADFQGMGQELLEHMSELSNTNADLSYFNDLGDNLEIVVNQMNDVVVPQTILPLHVKFLRLAKGLLTLRERPSTSNDPLGRMLTMTKANDFIGLYSDFFTNDFQNYIKDLKN